MKLNFFVVFFIFGPASTKYLIKNIDQCSSSGKTATVLKCHSDEARKTVILEANITKIVDKLNITVIVEKLVMGRFQQLFKYPDIDWCKFMSKGLKTSAVVKLIVDAIKSSSSSILHKCPYLGLHVANISVSTDVIKIVPSGLYGLTILGRTDDDDNFADFRLVTQVGGLDN